MLKNLQNTKMLSNMRNTVVATAEPLNTLISITADVAYIAQLGNMYNKVDR